MDAPPASPRRNAPSHVKRLLESLAQVTNRKKESGPFDPYISAARWFPLAIHPFADLRTVIYSGIEADCKRVRAQEDDEDDDTQDDPETMSKEAKKLHDWHAKLYKQFKALIPGFDSIIPEFDREPVLLRKFADMLVLHASNARSEDLHSLKVNGIRYILENPGRETFNPPLDINGGKGLRGWSHPQTACLLCPLQCLDEFDEDPADFMDCVNSGKVKMSASQLPSFLFDQSDDRDLSDTAEWFDAILPDDNTKTYRHIFTGPGTALTGVTPTRVRGCKAKLHGLQAPTPNTIAYAVIQTWLFLSSKEMWGKMDGGVNLHRLYDYVLTLLDMKDGLRHKHLDPLMDWWKENVPGLSQHNQIRDEETDEDDDTNDIAYLLRKAREASEDEDVGNPDEQDDQQAPQAQRLTDITREDQNRRNLRMATPNARKRVQSNEDGGYDDENRHGNANPDARKRARPDDNGNANPDARKRARPDDNGIDKGCHGNAIPDARTPDGDGNGNVGVDERRRLEQERSSLTPPPPPLALKKALGKKPNSKSSGAAGGSKKKRN